MKFFNPQNCIQRMHPTVHSWGTQPDGHYGPLCVAPPQYEILIFTEEWGYYPVQGSGRMIRSEIPESEKRRVHLCTQEERDAFMAQYFPYTREYELEQIENSAASACL